MSEQPTGHAGGLGWPQRGSDHARSGKAERGRRGSGLGWPAGDGDEETRDRGEDDRGGAAGEPSDTQGGADVSRETSSPWQAVGRVSGVPSARSLLASSPGMEGLRLAPDLPIAAEAAAAVHAARLLRDPLPRPERTRVVVVANQKGGVGKTTTAVNVAAALAMHANRVLVVDMDPQGNATTALGLDAHRRDPGAVSTYDVLVDRRPLADAVQPCPDVPGLLAVPSSIDVAGADVELATTSGRELLLRHALAGYLREHDLDYVVVDCPPTLGLLTINALAAGLEVLIPIQCEYYALEGLSQLLTTIDLVRDALNPALAVAHVVLTMYDGRTRLAGEVAEEVRRHFGSRVLPTAVPRSVRLSEAPGFGQTVLTYAPGSPGALSYLEAARSIAHRPPALPVPPVKESA